MVEVVKVSEVGVEALLVHDETIADPGHAFNLAQMAHPEFPVPMGVFRQVQEPSWDQRLHEQIAQVKQKSGEGDLERLLNSGDTWDIV